MAEPTNTSQNTGDEEEQNRLFDGNDPDEVKETVTAGLTSEEVGINALSGAELSDPTRAENHAGGEKSAQDVTNELDESAQGYASGHDSGVSQKEQYDVAMSGAAEGRHEGTYFDQVQEQKEFREREERKNIAVRAVTTYAALLDYVNDLGQDLDDAAKDVAETASRVAETERLMNEQIDMIDQEIAEQEQLIQEMEARGLETQTDYVAYETAQERLKGLQMIREAVANEKDELVNAQRESEQALAETRQAFEQKRQEVVEAERTGEGNIEELRQELEGLRGQLQEVELANDRVNQRVEFALQGSQQYRQLMDYMTSDEHDLAPGTIQDLSEFTASFINARSDGVIDQDEIAAIRSRLQDSSMSDQAKQGIERALEASIASSGVGVATGQLDADGNQIYAYGEDATAALLSGLRTEITEADTDYADVSSDASAAVSQLESQRDTLEDELQTHIEQLDAIRNGTSDLSFMQDDEMQEAQLALKMAEIENARARLSLLNNTIDRTQDQLDATRDSYVQAHQDLRRLEGLKAAGEETFEGQDIDELISGTRDQISAYKDQIDELGNRADLAQSISELAIRIEGKSMSCGLTAEQEYMKADVIDARTAITRYIEEATNDGKIDQTEMNNIHTLFNKAQISDASRQAFVSAFASSGGEVQNAQGEYVTGNDASEILLAQLAEVQAEQTSTRAAIESTSDNREELQAQLSALQAQRAQQQETLNSAQATLDAETAETAEVVADAQGAQAGMMAYESVYDYMSSNYSHMGMGSGENVSDVAAQADRMLTDNSGNLVYVNPDTQQMYTLAKNNDGSVATGSDGRQIQVPVSAEDTADLYRKMFDEKLLPRNFVPDGDGVLGFGKTEVAFAEHSEHDSFAESIGKSLIPGNMGKEEFSQVIESSVEAQRAEEEAARLAQSEAQADVEEARLAMEQASNNLNATDSEIRALQQRLAALEAEEQRLTQQATEQGIDATAVAASSEDGAGDWDGTESMQLKTSEEYQNAIVDVYRQIESGSINRADLDQALGADVSPELRQQIEAALERDGVQIEEPENEIASDLDNTNDDVQLASSAQVTASFPFLGIGPFQVDQIPSPQAQPDPNGIYPSMKYESFADSMEFASTNPTNGPEPTYLDPVNNGTKDTPSAGDTFAMALTNQSGAPATAGSTIQPPQLSAEDAIRLQREEELRMAENQAGLNSTGGSMV
ncbi:MAG: hypothetical protein ACTHOO_08410 [Alcanivorax sp.]